MDIVLFAEWVKEKFDFDCFENDFFEKSLMSCKKEFERKSIDGVPYESYYKDQLHPKFLKAYRSHLKLLLKQLQQQSAQCSLLIGGVDLSLYRNRIDELQYSILKLDS